MHCTLHCLNLTPLSRIITFESYLIDIAKVSSELYMEVIEPG